MIRITPWLAAALLVAAPAFGEASQPADKAKAAAPSEGEVRKVDKAAGKVTLKHGPIPNLEMPPMTMVFKVKDAAMLDNVKAGDAVRFKAENINGAYIVTELVAAK